MRGGNTRFKPTHGMRKSKEYRIWQDMLNRCRNPKVRSYKNYGGRGIVVCERWKIFKNFFDDMGERPSAQHCIDRKNVNGNYEPLNTRWALKINLNKENTRNNRFLFKDRRLTAVDLAKEIGIDPRTFRKRLSYGMSLEKAKTPNRIKVDVSDRKRNPRGKFA